jgi:N-terminal domain of (some) glycogen debranching enzymes
MEHRWIIKHGAVVVTTEEVGSIDPTGTFTQGLFARDTGFLSRFRLSLDGIAPSLMGSGEEKPHQAGYLFSAHAFLKHLPRR